MHKNVKRLKRVLFHKVHNLKIFVRGSVLYVCIAKKKKWNFNFIRGFSRSSLGVNRYLTCEIVFLSVIIPKLTVYKLHKDTVHLLLRIYSNFYIINIF